jgi:hypothetical protein
MKRKRRRKVNLLPEAVNLVQRGFHIFPVEPNAKTPIRIYQDRSAEDAPWTIKWSEVATNDINKVIEYWTWCPSANIGVACAPSGLLVVDCDVAKSDWNLRGTQWEGMHSGYGMLVPKDTPRIDGEIVYAAVAKHYGDFFGVNEAFDTLIAATRSGGLHLYYRWPEGVKASQASIVRGVVDIRCNGGERGGYVLGPGSTIDGNGYRIIEDRAIAVAPPWLVELCRDKPKPKAPLGRAADAISQPRNANFSGLVDTVRCAPDGNLNNSLLWAARSMCADGATETEAADLLAPVYVQCGGRGGQKQAEATIRSAFRLQRGKM